MPFAWMNEDLQAHVTSSTAGFLSRVARVVVRSRPVSALIEATLDQTVIAFPGSAASLYLADGAARRLRIAGSRNVSASVLGMLSDVPFDAPLAVALAARTREIQIFGQYDLGGPEHEVLRVALAGRTVIAVPLLAANQLIGSAVYVLPARYEFSGDELTTFEAVGSIIGTGIANALAQDELERLRRQGA